MDAGNVGCDAAGGAADLLLRCPASLEKFEERIEQAMKDASALRKRLFAWAARVGLQAGYDAMHRYTSVTQFHIFHSLTFSINTLHSYITHTFA